MRPRIDIDKALSRAILREIGERLQMSRGRRVTAEPSSSA